MQNYNNNYYLKESNIHGLGIHSNKNIYRGNIIGIGIYFKIRIIPYVTEDFGKWINHSNKPNAYLQYDTINCLYLVMALNDINKNTEITLDYNKTPWYIRKPEPHFV